MRITQRLLMMTVCAMLGCSGNGLNSDVDGGRDSTGDGGAEPAASVVGRWFWRAPNDWTTKYEIRVDGSITVDQTFFGDNARSIEGTWSISEDVLSIEGDIVASPSGQQRYRAEHHFALEAGELLMDALRPIGDPVGLVTTWSRVRRTVIDGNEQNIRYDLMVGADGVSRYLKIVGDRVTTYPGKWVETEYGLAHTFVNIYGEERTLSFYLVDGALGLEHNEPI